MARAEKLIWPILWGSGGRGGEGGGHIWPCEDAQQNATVQGGDKKAPPNKRMG